MLANFRGPEIQGVFSLTKAEIDFLTAVCLVGMPQALFYYSKRGKIGPRQSVTLALVQAVIAIVLTVGYKSLSTQDSHLQIGSLLIAAAAAAAVCWGSMRGAVLSASSRLGFAIFSIAPPVLVLVLVVLSVRGPAAWLGTANTFAGLFLGAYGVGCAFGVIKLWAWRRVAEPGIKSGLVLMLYRYGVSTWLSVILQSGLLLLALHWVDSGGSNRAGAGILAAGFSLIGIAVTPLNLISPLLFRQWTGADIDTVLQGFREASFIIILLAIVFAGSIWWLGEPLVGLLFGPIYTHNVMVFGLLSLAAGPQCFAKLSGVLYNSLGKPILTVVIDAVRFFCIGIGIAVVGKDILRVAAVWAGAEFIACGVAIMLAIHTTDKIHLSIHKTTS